MIGGGLAGAGQTHIQGQLTGQQPSGTEYTINTLGGGYASTLRGVNAVKSVAAVGAGGSVLNDVASGEQISVSSAIVNAGGNAIGFRAGGAIKGMGGAQPSKISTFLTGSQMRNQLKIGGFDAAAAGISQGAMINAINTNSIGIFTPVSSINLDSFTPSNLIDTTISAPDEDGSDSDT